MKLTKWIITGVIVVCAIFVGALLMNRPSPPSRPVTTASTPVAPVAKAPSAPETTSAEETAAPPVQLAKQPMPQSNPSHPKPQKTLSSTPKPPKEPLHDPDARDALALVGLDPQAERYWLDAIFDTSLPDNEREDLMEDLNEVGFADPKNLTADDLPLIANRLQIIEELEPSINDPFMSEHLGEAYKDLVDMYAKAAGR